MQQPITRPHGLVQPVNNVGGVPARAAPLQPEVPEDVEIDIGEFIQKWNLGDGAQTVLYGLDPLVQQRAMHQFAPRDISRDVSNMFCKFAQGVARSQELLFPGGSPQANAVREDQVDTSEFVNKWSLGPDAQAMLSGFIPDMQQKIMREFCPRDASQDCNNIF